MAKKRKRGKMSSRMVAGVFAAVFAIVGITLLGVSRASTPELTAQQSNQKAFEEIKANFAKHGVKLKAKTDMPAKPKDFGTFKPLAEPKLKSNTPTNLRQEIPDFPDLSKIKEPVSDNGSFLTPKAHADGWTRATAVANAQKFLGWKGSHFFYYGVFPNEEWCSDFASYIMKGVGRPFYWGTDGWRIQRVDNVIVGLYATNNLRSKGNYTPRTGDLVFFDWGDGGISDHIGIVESVDSKGGVHTIEGNTNHNNRNYSEVARKTWAGNSPHIIGYGVWLGS